jgi:hypothetical protein
VPKGKMADARQEAEAGIEAEPSKMWTQAWQGHYFVRASEARN